MFRSAQICVGKVVGFCLQAGIWARAAQRQKLERVCGHIGRPAVFETLHPNEQRANVVRQ